MNSPIPSAPVSPAKVIAAPVAQLLALEQLLADPNQPRKVFDEAALKELAESIRTQGLLQAILVKPNGKGYFIVDGERRYRAAKILGLKEVPVLVRADLKDQDVTAQQLVANLQREDLALPEQCEAVAKLVKQLGSAKAAAEKLGKSEAWVSKRAGAGAFPPEVKALVEKGQIVDVELAAGLAEFKEVVKASPDAKSWGLDRCLRAARNGTLTRAELRDEIKREKDNQEWQRKQRAAAEKEQARQAAEKAGKKPGAADDSKERDRYAEAQRRVGRVMNDRKALKEKVEAALYQGMKLDEGEAPVALQYLQSGSDYLTFPKSAEACKFDFQASGDIQLLTKLAHGLPGKVSVRVEEMHLSLEDAAKISKALAGAPGFKELFLSFEHEVSGQDLRTAVKKLAPEQFDSLPLTRAEKEAGKKKAPAPTKPAIKAKKKGK